MPVKSLHSAVLKWPDAQSVREAVQKWAAKLKANPNVIKVGYFGSYARGDWGVGSDLDLIVIVQTSKEPFARRAASFDTTALPVPADLIVYTHSEWESLDKKSRFYQTLQKEAVWL